MKFTLSIFVLLFAIIVFSSSGCKKNKTTIIPTCGCNDTATKYNIINGIGTLQYFSFNHKWTFRISPNIQTNIYYFPCNTNQDSLTAILKNAQQNDIFQVKFSGKVKEPCHPDDSFPYTVDVTIFNYIIVDSLKRN